MTRPLTSLLSTFGALGFVLAAGCALGESDEVGSFDDEDGEEYEEWDGGKADGLPDLGGAISFAAACRPGTTVTVAAVGDVLLHGALQKQAIREEDRFISLWAGVGDLLGQADVTYANLEGPTAAGVNSSGRAVTDPGFVFDDHVYTSYPQFNYHPYLIEDLQDSGIDVVSTANNHALDRRALGVDRTIEALTARGLPWTGTRARGDDASPWYTITTVGELKVAWLACTYATNGIPDNEGQVLDCYEDADHIVTRIQTLAGRDDVDAILVTPHWGQEYVATPTRSQINLGHRFLDAGATAIVGSHPHVLEPWEKYVTADGRETFLIYSLGNFVSGQTSLARRSTILLYLALTRGEDGRTRVTGVRYVPLYMSRIDDFRSVVAIDREGGHADARALITRMFGTENLQDPNAPLAFDACP